MIEKMKPELKPHIGCLNCGCGEMKLGKKEILISLKTRIYQGFGGWCIHRNGKTVFWPEPNLEFDKYPTLMKFELQARKKRGDWRAMVDLPLRSAEYQRQGKNRWVLVKSGQGFA